MEAIARKEWVMLVDGISMAGVYAESAADARAQFEGTKSLVRKVSLISRWRAQGRPVRLGGRGQRVEREEVACSA